MDHDYHGAVLFSLSITKNEKIKQGKGNFPLIRNLLAVPDFSSSVRVFFEDPLQNPLTSVSFLSPGIKRL